MGQSNILDKFEDTQVKKHKLSTALNNSKQKPALASLEGNLNADCENFELNLACMNKLNTNFLIVRTESSQ